MTATVQKVAVLGAGSWGTAFAKIVADAAAEQNSGVCTVLWGRNPEAMEESARTQTNQKYFPGVRLPEGIEFTADVEHALRGAQLVVVAVPAQSLRAFLRECVHLLEPDAVLLSLAKGLEQGTQQRMSQVICAVLQEEAGDSVEVARSRVAVLSGPNLAREIMAEQPTASVIAAAEESIAQKIARLTACSYFRPYTGTDIVGVEIGGLAKNVIALCVGMCEGMGYGDNSKASVITRGLAEITRLALALGAEPATMSGLAGVGDLVATCSSPLSRNHTAGRLLAEGVKPQDLASAMSQTAESVKTAPVVVELAREHGVEMPISEAVVAVLSEQPDIAKLAPRLLGRTLKNENSTASLSAGTEHRKD